VLERLWLDDAGVETAGETITYCTTAVRASVGWFILRQLGWEDCRNYEGSWHDWGNPLGGGRLLLHVR
jgi:thiosulfate/3-mercaptopyruvate sulfurtransferase